MEPGKALAQPTTLLVASVLHVTRDADGVPSEVVVDASIAELPDLHFHPHPLAYLGKGADPSLIYRGHGFGVVYVRLCMETDILAIDVGLPRNLEPGDRLVWAEAGAYDVSMGYAFGRGADVFERVGV